MVLQASSKMIKFRSAWNRKNARDSIVEITTDVAEEDVVERNYQRVREGRIEENVGSSHFPKDGWDMLLLMRAFAKWTFQTTNSG